MLLKEMPSILLE